ncbi:MAG: hydroxymethylglutaryl-CoA lyase [Chitinophagaceae bacterium]
MSTGQNIKLIECPRDAMQGWKTFIPTEQKIEYINSLLKVGFDTIDFGSFVSPKAIPQMADTKDVIAKLQLTNSKSKLLAIIANERGADDAVLYDEISYLGFPFSVSETFQQRNTNSSIAESLKRVEAIQELCLKNQKQLVVYLSMGFGNPYGDDWTKEIVFRWANELAAMDIKIISLADTVGLATPEQVQEITTHLIKELKGVEVGVHLHSTAANRIQKLEAALNSGCKRFDGALKGIGGCPMADDELVGNMNTEVMISYFEQQGIMQGINKEALVESLQLAARIFAA